MYFYNKINIKYIFYKEKEAKFDLWLLFADP